MRHFIIRLLFGAEDLATHMAKLLTLHATARSQHAQAKQLEVDLAQKREALAVTKTQYAWTRTALEDAYKLELD